ncbi:hypothetical protein ACWDAZ_17520 [Streptomyces sp. NPDC001215]
MQPAAEYRLLRTLTERLPDAPEGEVRSPRHDEYGPADKRGGNSLSGRHGKTVLTDDFRTGPSE